MDELIYALLRNVGFNRELSANPLFEIRLRLIMIFGAIISIVDLRSNRLQRRTAAEQHLRSQTPAPGSTTAASQPILTELAVKVARRWY